MNNPAIMHICIFLTATGERERERERESLSSIRTDVILGIAAKLHLGNKERFENEIMALKDGLLPF